MIWLAMGYDDCGLFRRQADLPCAPEEAKMPLGGPEILDEVQRAAIELVISDCVQRFYAKGVADPLLGPVFTSAIPDLPAHLEIIKNFW